MSKDIFYDKDIREPLFDFQEDSFGKVRILEEKRTGRDIAKQFYEDQAEHDMYIGEVVEIIK